MQTSLQASKHRHLQAFDHHFADDNAKFTQLKLGKIPFIADAGLDKPQASFNKFIKGIRSAPAKVL